MKKRLAAVLAFVMVLCTCMNAMAGSYSLKWTQKSDGNWQVYKNGVLLKNTWVLDDECNVAGGVWYLIDENGNMVVAPLVHDGEGRYYAFNDQHNGYYGAMLTANGSYYGVKLNFEHTHNGGYGSITNADGIAALTAKYGVKEMPAIKNAATVKLSEVSKTSSGSDDGPVYYSVSFNLNHNNATPSQIKAQSVAYGSKLVKPASPSDLSAEMDFTGWTRTQDGTDYWDFATDTVTKSFTLYAKWRGEEGYTVTYDGNGATGEAPADSTAYESGDTVTIKDKGSLAKEGYQFKYWSLTPSGQGGGSYAPGDTYTINRDVTFYAIWEKKAAGTCIVTYLNNGADNPQETPIDSKQYKAGDTVTIKDKGNLVKEGYTFKNWNTKEDSTGSVYVPGQSYQIYGDLTLYAIWEQASGGGDFLTFTAEEAGSTVTFNYKEGENVKYSTDGGVTWTDYTKGDKITLEKIGDAVSFKGNNVVTGYDAESKTYFNFSMTGKIAASGDVTSLTNGVGGDAELSTYCYHDMFLSCASLTKAPELPSSQLASYCYYAMFSKCTALTETPELGATTLADYCYNSMFSGCTSLKTASDLNASKLAEGCYKSMFGSCTSLEEAPAIKADEMAKSSCHFMFNMCSSLTSVPELSASTLAEDCYTSMFYRCVALETAPELPATTLADRCYKSMFDGCTSLKEAPDLPAETLTEQCYCDMFKACTSLKSAPSLKSTTLAKECYRQMFMYCSGLENAPALPATTLCDGCYWSMFEGCSYLKNAPALPATTLCDGCYQRMFMNCSCLTTVPALSATTLADNCYNSMFGSCTSLYVSDDSGAECTKEWVINGDTEHITESSNAGSTMFYNCKGTRTSQSCPVHLGNQTYYTQNDPVVAE